MLILRTLYISKINADCVFLHLKKKKRILPGGL